MTFANPWLLLLLLALPLPVYLTIKRRSRPNVSFSALSLVAGTGSSLRQRLIHLPLILRVTAIVLLVIALARPRQGLEKVYDISQGIAIEMVVDRSSSMAAEMNFGGETLTRLEVVKRVFAEFILGNGDTLTGRPNDLAGLIDFAGYADTISPLTLAHGALNSFLGQIKLVTRKSEDGTAIGDALMLAAARLKTAEEDLARYNRAAGWLPGGDQPKNGYEIKSKIIILLTDGQNNRGRTPPARAAALAKKWGIKIYAIGVGSDQDTFSTGFFGIRIPQAPAVDRELLSSLAETTGGQFRMAGDASTLREIYQEIDQLEKSKVESVRHLDYREKFPPFALAGLVLLALEILLNSTWLRRIP